MAQRYVGIDLHRRRSVIYAIDGEGTKLSCVRIDNNPVALARAVADRRGLRSRAPVHSSHGARGS